MRIQTSLIFALSGVVLLAGIGGVALRSKPSMRVGDYIDRGYGGFVAPTLPVVKGAPSKIVAAAPKPVATPDPLAPAVALYHAGRFAEVKRETEGLKRKSPATAARAARLAGFAVAREAQKQKDLAKRREGFIEASAQFAAAREAAQAVSPEQASESAYQEAVCTAAAGDKVKAEEQFVALMRNYPTSSHVQASIKRIARLHGGDVPAAAEAIWKAAMAKQKASQEEQRRQLALCGPVCLQELMKRQGKPSLSLDTLASEMKTTGDGTNLLALRESARKHGYPQAEGVLLTAEGLKGQKLPLIALITPEHFVVVESMDGQGQVQLWDPRDEGTRRLVSAKQWATQWQGVALTLATPKQVVAKR